jgi:hypothetical protein
VVLQAAPIKVFLSFMSVEGSMESLRRTVRGVKMLQQIDDHTDVIHFTLPQRLVRFFPPCICTNPARQSVSARTSLINQSINQSITQNNQ